MPYGNELICLIGAERMIDAIEPIIFGHDSAPRNPIGILFLGPKGQDLQAIEPFGNP
jgi:hypothetical protein